MRFAAEQFGSNWSDWVKSIDFVMSEPTRSVRVCTDIALCPIECKRSCFKLTGERVKLCSPIETNIFSLPRSK